MRIAQIVPLTLRVPPKKYGGTERVVQALTEELVRRGHDVTLFASGDSVTSAKLEAVFPTSLIETRIRPLYGLNEPLLHSVGRVFNKSDEFDIIHDHTCTASLPFAELVKTPVLATLHGHIEPTQMPLFHEFRKTNLVAISQDQYRGFEGLNGIGVVHNGLSMQHYPFSNEHDGYLLYVGRICKEKGTRYAVALARELGLRLIIAAKIEETEAGHRHFRKYVKPYLNDKITWIGEVDEVERNKLMTRAMAFIHPVTWREPFGLTLIEAMACGAPVIAFGLGSIPEIIEHKRTGFVVDTYEQMVEAMRLIPTIDRAYTRAYVLSHFNTERMTDNYEKLYRQLATKQITAPTSTSTPSYLSRKLLK